MTRLATALAIVFLSGCAGSKPSVEEQPVTAESTQTPEPDSAPAVDPIIEKGRVATKMFYGGENAALHARFSDEMLAALPAEQWAAVQAKTVADLGPETEVVAETSGSILDNDMYYRTVTFEKAEGVSLVLSWGFREDGTITGFNIKPRQSPADTSNLDYKTETPLRVPFDGEWTVVWGGRTVEQNYHAVDETQRFALDLLVTGPDRRSHTGDRTKNESYHAFGKKVLSPGAGKVTAVESSVVDNVPGEMNPKQLAGNYVLIQHGEGFEYSLLAHFKQGSVTVKVGDEVQQGQLLGLCGNSGNSSEPHIHYHLQASPTPLGGGGLPIQFTAAMIDGELRESVELEQGQRVRPAN